MKGLFSTGTHLIWQDVRHTREHLGFNTRKPSHLSSAASNPAAVGSEALLISEGAFLVVAEPCQFNCGIDRQQFEETVRTLNNLYAEAEKLGGQSYLEGCLACLTAYTIFLCMETHYEKIPSPAGTLISPLADRRVSPTSSPEHHSFVSAARATVPFTPRTDFLNSAPGVTSSRSASTVCLQIV
ncbi:hypothetical protein CB1_001095030 [Camelus ferus]|nr:hypothetical protein CB1_001095030 [Camelus ferus]